MFNLNLTQNNHTIIFSVNKPKDPSWIQSIQLNILIPIPIWLIAGFFDFIKNSES